MFNSLSTILICSITGVAVNLYVMITGYFMINKYELRLRRFEKTWFQTMFYAIGFILIAFVISPNILHFKLIAQLFYLNTGYWFVNKYLGLILIAPFLARFASYLSRKEYQLLLLILGIINISIYAPFTTIMGEVTHGVSLQWFIFLFFVAGYIRKFELFKGSRHTFLYFLCAWILNFTYILLERHLSGSLSRPLPYLPYNGIIFFESLFLFLFFRDYNFKSKYWKPFVILAPYTFGIYLIHENHFISYYLWQGSLSPSHLLNSWQLIPYMFALTTGVFLTCAFIDYIRGFIVRKLRMNNILNIINTFTYRKLDIFIKLSL